MVTNKIVRFFLINVFIPILLNYTLPFKALNTQAIAKKPTPTAPNPQPATSSYLKTPKAISKSPMLIISQVA